MKFYLANENPHCPKNNRNVRTKTEWNEWSGCNSTVNVWDKKPDICDRQRLS